MHREIERVYEGRVNVSRIDDVIADVDYIRDTLVAYRNIIRTGCCHSCGIAKECAVKPDYGQMVRYNCPGYVKDGIEKKREGEK